MTKEEKSPLVTAAMALDLELRNYEDLAEQLDGVDLNSEKHLERAARQITRIADCEDRLGVRVQEMVAAITNSRTKQQSQAERVATEALRLQKRTEEFRGLLDRMRTLGDNAQEITTRMNQVSQDQGNGHADQADQALLDGMVELQGRMRSVAEEAAAIMRDADALNFSDVTKQADGLRQQLEAAHDRLGKVHEKLSKG